MGQGLIMRMGGGGSGTDGSFNLRSEQGSYWEFIGDSNYNVSRIKALPSGRLVANVMYDPEWGTDRYAAYSDDNGITWTASNLLFDTVDAGFAYIPNIGLVTQYYDSNNENYYIALSVDGGETWELSYARFDAYMIYDFIVLQSGSVLGYGGDGIFKYSGDIGNWLYTYRGDIKDIIQLPSGRIIATIDGTDELITSYDNAVSWDSLNPTDPDGSLYFRYLTVSASGTLYASEDNAVIYSSIDEGRTWKLFCEIGGVDYLYGLEALDNGQFLVCGDYGMCMFDENADHRNVMNGMVLEICVTSNRVFVQTQNGCFYSDEIKNASPNKITVTPEIVRKGYTACDSSGKLFNGLYNGPVYPSASFLKKGSVWYDADDKKITGTCEFVEAGSAASVITTLSSFNIVSITGHETIDDTPSNDIPFSHSVNTNINHIVFNIRITGLNSSQYTDIRILGVAPRGLNNLEFSGISWQENTLGRRYLFKISAWIDSSNKLKINYVTDCPSGKYKIEIYKDMSTSSNVDIGKHW